MANYELVVNSKFQPFSFERYIQPYQIYGQAYREVENTLGEVQEVETEREVDIKAVKNKLTNGNIGFPLQVRYGIGISNIAAMPYILPKKRIITKDGNEVYMIEGSGAWNTLTFNIKDDKGNISNYLTVNSNEKDKN